GVEAAEPGLHGDHRPAAGEVADAAVAEPAAIGADIDVLGDGELATRSRDELGIALHASRNGPGIGEAPAMGDDFGRDLRRRRRHRHGEALRHASRQIEETQEIDMLRPDIGLAGETYVWSKQVNFLRLLDLPRRVPQCFTMAMSPPTPEIAAEVTAHGWRLADPGPISAGMESYAEFIAGSRGEFTVAKDIYVRPNSGWFSDRSVCYLACGRPVITMKTGFSRFYPTGEGLFEFSDM